MIEINVALGKQVALTLDKESEGFLMRISKAIGLAAVLAAPALVSVSLAQNAPECPIAGTLSTFGINSAGVFNVAPGGACLFPLRIEGVIAARALCKARQTECLDSSTNPHSSTRQTPATQGPIPSPFR